MSNDCPVVQRSLLRLTCSVIAGVRSPESATDLQKLKDEHGDSLSVVKLDITDEESIEVEFVFICVYKPLKARQEMTALASGYIVGSFRSINLWLCAASRLVL